MKIYVDELPKRCLECGFCCKDDLGYWCQGREDVEAVFIADEICTKERLMSCPLQSLADHDKQVREEVVDEIKEKFNDTIKHHFCPNPSSVDFITLCISEVEEFLDQVKGETK